MKYLSIKITISILLLINISACKKEPLYLDYCKMIYEDQTYVNNNKSDTAQFKADREMRNKIFKKNFDLIMKKTKQDGFPIINRNYNAEDSCKFFAVTMTMIHTAQSNPNAFFSKTYADIFRREIDLGNLDKKLLSKSSIITANTIDLCNELKPEIRYALNLWGLDANLFKEANFIDCN